MLYDWLSANYRQLSSLIISLLIRTLTGSAITGSDVTGSDVTGSDVTGSGVEFADNKNAVLSVLATFILVSRTSMLRTTNKHW